MERLRNEVQDFDIEYFALKDSMPSNVERVVQLVDKSSKIRTKITKIEATQTKPHEKSELVDEALNLSRDTETVMEKYGTDQDKEQFKLMKQELGKVIEDYDKKGLTRSIKNLNDLRITVLFRQYEVWQDYFNWYSSPQHYYINESEANFWKEYGYMADRERDFLKLKEAVLHLDELRNKGTFELVKDKQLPPGLRRK